MWGLPLPIASSLVDFSFGFDVSKLCSFYATNWIHLCFEIGDIIQLEYVIPEPEDHCLCSHYFNVGVWVTFTWTDANWFPLNFRGNIAHPKSFSVCVRRHNDSFQDYIATSYFLHHICCERSASTMAIQDTVASILCQSHKNSLPGGRA